jgi:hypothetical protein
MPYPAFYQHVFDASADSGAYDRAVLYFLARIGGRLRKDKETVSIADETAAVMQSAGLAALRGKPCHGVYELLDAVKSAFIKGPIDYAAARSLRSAEELLRGEKLGEINSGAAEPPLLVDFRQQCDKFRLKTKATTRQEVVLDILTKPKHQEESSFFHRMFYLKTGFCELRFGPDYSSRDASRVREKWEYALHARVEAAVIDVSWLGGTVREAASSSVSRAAKEAVGAGVCTRLLIDSAVMRLSEHITPLLDAAEEAIADDGSFPSLITAAKNLLFLENARWLLNLEDSGRGGIVASLLGAVYMKGCAILPTLAAADETDDMEHAASLKSLYQIANRTGVEAELLTEALTELCERRAPLPSPCMHGAAIGLLYSSCMLSAEDVLASAASYMFASGEPQARAGRFLSGLFKAAPDIFFGGTGFIDGISHLLRESSEECFLTLLTDLRLAFSAFTPGEIDRIAELVADSLGVGEKEMKKTAQSDAL